MNIQNDLHLNIYNFLESLCLAIIIIYWVYIINTPDKELQRLKKQVDENKKKMQEQESNYKYKLRAEFSKKLVRKGVITQEEAEKEVRIYEFLSTCNQDDLCRLINSSAFNHIIKAYLNKSLTNAQADKEIIAKTEKELDSLFENHTTKEVIKNENSITYSPDSIVNHNNTYRENFQKKQNLN